MKSWLGVVLLVFAVAFLVVAFADPVSEAREVRDGMFGTPSTTPPRVVP